MPAAPVLPRNPPGRNVSLWLKYVEMEMRHRFINHARNIWDRAGEADPPSRRPCATLDAPSLVVHGNGRALCAPLHVAQTAPLPHCSHQHRPACRRLACSPLSWCLVRPLAAVSLLPRIDQLWYKYIHMEEMLGNVAGARQIFERWMQWEPDHHGWMAYVKVRRGWGAGCAGVGWS